MGWGEIFCILVCADILGTKVKRARIRPQCVIYLQFPLVYLSEVLKPKNQEKNQPARLDCALVVRDGICNGGLF